MAWLLAHGANLHLHKEDSWRDTVLHYAAAAGSLDCCKILLAFGSDPRAKNFAGVMGFALGICCVYHPLCLLNLFIPGTFHNPPLRHVHRLDPS